MKRAEGRIERFIENFEFVYVKIKTLCNVYV